MATKRTTENLPKLTPAQHRVLSAAANGHLIRNADMGWFQKGGYRIRSERNPNPATVEKLIDLGLLNRGRIPLGEISVTMTVTAAGMEVLG